MALGYEGTIYTIDQSNSYFIDVTHVPNIEEVDDIFYSYEELCEMFDVSHVSTGVTIRRDKIVERLSGYKREMIKNSKRSIIMDDVDLVEFLKQNDNWSVSDFVEGLRRVGNRLSLFDKKEKVGANKRDFAKVINNGAVAVSKINGLTLEFKYLESKQFENALGILKKLITLEQLIEQMTANLSSSYYKSGSTDEQFKNFFDEQLRLAQFVWDHADQYSIKNA